MVKKSNFAMIPDSKRVGPDFAQPIFLMSTST